MVRRTLGKRLRLWFRPSIHREEESLIDMPPITTLHLLADNLPHAELCLLGCNLVVRQFGLHAYPSYPGSFLLPVYICTRQFFPPSAIAPLTR